MSDTPPGPTSWTLISGDICVSSSDGPPVYAIWRNSTKPCDGPDCSGDTPPDPPSIPPACVGTTHTSLTVDLSNLTFSSGAAGNVYDSVETYRQSISSSSCGGGIGYAYAFLAQTFTMVQVDGCTEFHNLFHSKTITYTLPDGSTLTDLETLPYIYTTTPNNTITYGSMSGGCFATYLGTGTTCTTGVQFNGGVQTLQWIPGNDVSRGYWQLTYMGCSFIGPDDCSTPAGRYYPDSSCYGYGGTGCPTDDHFTGYIEVLV